jgi:hypothetical protein
MGKRVQAKKGSGFRKKRESIFMNYITPSY